MAPVVVAPPPVIPWPHGGQAGLCGNHLIQGRDQPTTLALAAVLSMEVLRSLEELKSEALKLAPEARAKLAQVLLESLEDLSEAEIERLWVEEAIHRDEEVDAGKVPLRPAVR